MCDLIFCRKCVFFFWQKRTMEVRCEYPRNTCDTGHDFYYNNFMYRKSVRNRFCVFQEKKKQLSVLSLQPRKTTVNFIMHAIFFFFFFRTQYLKCSFRSLYSISKTAHTRPIKYIIYIRFPFTCILL